MIVAQCDWCKDTHPNVSWHGSVMPMDYRMPKDWLFIGFELHEKRYQALACSKACALSWLAALPIEEVQNALPSE